jgi:hypothetical protein
MTCLAEEFVVEEAKPFVDVGQDPGVGVDVEAVDHLKLTMSNYNSSHSVISTLRIKYCSVSPLKQT